jgi:hypothetical protein
LHSTLLPELSCDDLCYVLDMKSHRNAHIVKAWLPVDELLGCDWILKTLT